MRLSGGAADASGDGKGVRIEHAVEQRRLSVIRRELFGNPGWGGESWIAQHSVLMAVVWPLLLTALFFPLAVARYRGLRR